MKWRSLSTRWQFFVALTGSSLVLIAMVLLGMRSYFTHNFSEYLAAQEYERLSQVAMTLALYYGEQEGEQKSEKSSKQNKEEGDKQHVGQSDSELQRWRLALQAIQRDLLFNPNRLNLDSQLTFTELSLFTMYGERVFGEQIAQPLSVAIVVEDEVVGLLSTLRPEGAIAPIDAVFQAQQTRSFLYAGAFAVILAAFVAAWLSAMLRRQVHKVAVVSRALAKGDYQARAQVEGRDDLSALAADMNELGAALGRSSEQRRQLLADVAHELRTPLTILQGDLEAVQDGIRPADAQHRQRLHHQVLHLARLTDDLYQLAQADAGELTYSYESYDVEQLTAQLIAANLLRATEKNLTLSYEVKGTPQPVYCDAARLQQALTNILENSLRYTEGSGRIVCQLLFQEQGNVCWQFDDTAPSLTVEECARLGERLYRPDTARSRSAGGSGLGLAIVRSIVQAHQGQLTFQASSLGGIQVSLCLPQQGSAE